jgi:hypothetical protein
LVQGVAAGVAATSHAQTVSGDDPQLTNARTPTVHGATHVAGDLVPLATTTAPGLMRQVSGNTTDFIDGTNNSQALQPVIWSVRLRSFNAVGNSTFEVDQRNIGAALTNPASGTFIQDRWSIVRSALTGAVNAALQNAPSSPIVIPGTNFGITQNFQRFTVGTAQASLASGDYFTFSQSLEGPRWRELALDVHSISLLVRSSVAGLTFTVRLTDATASHSLVKLCTIPSAATWTLVTLPNLPVWAGTYSAVPGAAVYSLSVCLACGSTYSAPANNAWQTGNVIGVNGMSNFLATVGATFDIAFVQHEPGSLCTTPIDCPFTQNYDDCQRYFQKSYDYKTAIGASGTLPGYISGTLPTGNTAYIIALPAFPKAMAKEPSLAPYNSSSGAANSVFNSTLGAACAVVAVAVSEKCISYINIGAPSSGTAAPGQWMNLHYTADTGW